MQGALGVLGAALVAERVAQVRVRVLLALGMLVGGEPEYGRALAAMPGAAVALMAAVRAGDDEDCRQVAAGLVAELVRRGLYYLETSRKPTALVRVCDLKAKFQLSGGNNHRSTHTGHQSCEAVSELHARLCAGVSGNN